jgi:hypothetical protein
MRSHVEKAKQSRYLAYVPLRLALSWIEAINTLKDIFQEMGSNRGMIWQGPVVIFSKSQKGCEESHLLRTFIDYYLAVNEIIPSSLLAVRMTSRSNILGVGLYLRQNTTPVSFRQPRRSDRY